jgi:hypothetical protein
MKNAVFWDVTPCNSYKNRHFGGSHRLHLQGELEPAVTSNRSTLRRNTLLRLLVTADVSTSPIRVNLLIEAMLCSETSIPTSTTRRNIHEDGIHHNRVPSTR